mmetsp:Transcript_108154/g.170525  ORF Transcript_108154/g.170525 Transcript_108154/m.170525 type:complete len:261 (-) Transcript_108154:21-803(-)
MPLFSTRGALSGLLWHGGQDVAPPDTRGTHAASGDHSTCAVPRCHRSEATAFASPPGGGHAKPPKAPKSSGTETDKEGQDDQEILPTIASGTSIEDILAAKHKAHREYKVLVDTGTFPSAGTQGEIYLQLLGNRGKTSLLKLKQGMQPMSRMEFSLFATDVGRVEKMRVVQNSTDRWFCDRIWFVAPEGNREFPVGQYIGFPNNPEVVVGPALAALGNVAVPLALALSMLRHAVLPAAAADLSKTDACLQRRQECGRKFL